MKTISRLMPTAFTKHLRQRHKALRGGSLTAIPTLTSGWHCVLKHLVELAEVHDHGEFVRLHHRRHLLASHAGGDAKLPLGHVKS